MTHCIIECQRVLEVISSKSPPMLKSLRAVREENCKSRWSIPIERECFVYFGIYQMRIEYLWRLFL